MKTFEQFVCPRGIQLRKKGWGRVGAFDYPAAFFN
jgi:hypothetical protein